MRAITAVALAFLFSGCSTVVPEPAETNPPTQVAQPARVNHAAEVAAIAGLIDAYEQAWLDGDADAVLDLFTGDAVLMPHHGNTPVTGKVAMRLFWWPKGADDITVTRLELEPVEVLAGGLLAFSRGRFQLAYTMDGQSFSNSGNWAMAFRKVAGQWLIARYIWNDPIADTG